MKYFPTKNEIIEKKNFPITENEIIEKKIIDTRNIKKKFICGIDKIEENKDEDKVEDKIQEENGKDKVREDMYVIDDEEDMDESNDQNEKQKEQPLEDGAKQMLCLTSNEKMETNDEINDGINDLVDLHNRLLEMCNNGMKFESAILPFMNNYFAHLMNTQTYLIMLKNEYHVFSKMQLIDYLERCQVKNKRKTKNGWIVEYFPLSTSWLKTKGKRTELTKIDFDPGMKNNNSKIFNTFRGWGWKLYKDSNQVDFDLIKPLVKFIDEVWANNNEDHFNYIMSWFADIIQNPNDPCSNYLLFY